LPLILSFADCKATCELAGILYVDERPLRKLKAFSIELSCLATEPSLKLLEQITKLILFITNNILFIELKKNFYNHKQMPNHKTKVVKPIQSGTSDYSLKLNYNIESDIKPKGIKEKDIFVMMKGENKKKGKKKSKA